MLVEAARMMGVANGLEPPWEAFHQRWASLAPPLRPDAEVCAAIRRFIDECAARVLVLGVTPELADLGRETFAMDWSANSLARIWPGNTKSRRAVQCDWRRLPVAAASITAAIGDGSFNCLDYPAGYERLFQQLACAVRPGGRIAVRTYLTPARSEGLAAVRTAAMLGRIGTVHALKWRLAMAICVEAGNPNVPVQTILEVFNREFPDRRALARATGWCAKAIALLDTYARSPDVFSFPTPAQILASVPEGLTGRLLAVGSYELAERCPVLAIEVRA
jgi:hypothetical protein